MDTEAPRLDPTVNSLDAYWMPFTANRQFKAAPRLVIAARDMHYIAHDGREVLDATAGLWCVNAGHCRPRITEAIQRQAAVMDFAPPFQMGNPLTFEAAARVAALFPPGVDHVFFANSGSEAVETALKIALGYHRMRGQGTRTRLIGRERAYHGVNFGGISVGGMNPNRKLFGAMLSGVDHLPHTYSLEHQAFSRGQPEWGAHLADALEAIVALHDASNIAAVIVEPMAGSTGVLVPPVGYLQRLRDICTRHGIVLIFDEVISGFGRLGAPFAIDRFGVEPDIVTLAKGITNAAVPMGAVIVRNEIHDAYMQGPEAAIELPHGYTYSGHPLAAAALIATLDTYRDEDLFARAAAMEPFFQDSAHALRGLPHVKDIRGIGMVTGIELDGRPGAPGARAYEVFLRCYQQGVLVRAAGEVLAISPPLIISRGQVEKVFETVADALRAVA
jgi:beta-alanine--pyruvate transaminase